jgi:hypothetical protein
VRRAHAGVALAAVAIAATAVAGLAEPDKITAGKAGFVEVVRVLQSPRCMNCHPAGDRPLQGDDGHVHAQNISRRTIAAGVPCSTCHQAHNADTLGIEHGPPGAPGWSLPPAEHPMVFQGRTATQLCEQLKDPAQNGGKNLAQLLDHVTRDEIVLWGWAPGKGRTLPPLPHDRFVAAFQAWVASGAVCP